jgi:hypothetical protein
MKNPFRSIGHFFAKTIPQGTKSFFTKTIPAVAGGAGTAIRNMGSAIGLGAGIAQKATDPLAKGLGLGAGIAGLVAPELAVPLGVAALGAKAINLGTGAVVDASKGRKFNALEKTVGSAQSGSKLFK